MDGTAQSAATPGIGHNLPAEEQAIRENMAEKYRSYQPRVEALLADGAKIPDVIPEDMIPTVTDYVGSCTGHIRLVDKTRKSEKDVYTRAGQVVDGFFKKMAEPLETFAAKIQKRLKVALDAKADRERREREEEARKEREAAEERRRIAEEQLRLEQERAAHAKREAEEAEARRIAESKRLAEETAAAEAHRRAAEEQAARDKALADELAAQNQAQVTSTLPESAANTLMGESAADSEVTPPTIPTPISLAERMQLEERERVAGLAARRTASAAEQAQRDLAEATRDAERATNRATAATMQHAKVVSAPSAEFARTRGEYGKIATLQDFWNHGPIDRDQLDKRAIWKFIPDEALLQAVRAYRDSFGGQEPKALKGVTFFKDTRGQVR